MCDICNKCALVWAHSSGELICDDCIDSLYCYGCFKHNNSCGDRYIYKGKRYCLTCVNILYETDTEYNEFLNEVNMCK